MQGVMLDVQGFAPNWGKSRLVKGLKIKCICPAQEMAPTNKSRSYEHKDLVCVFVLEVGRDCQRWVFPDFQSRKYLIGAIVFLCLFYFLES